MVLQIWDTAGQERFRALNKTFYKNSLGAMVIFDLNDRTTFEKLDKWMEELSQNLEEVAVTNKLSRLCSSSATKATCPTSKSQ